MPRSAEPYLGLHCKPASFVWVTTHQWNKYQSLCFFVVFFFFFFCYKRPTFETRNSQFCGVTAFVCVAAKGENAIYTVIIQS